MAKKLKTITLCSSVSFYKDVLSIEKQLKKLGFKTKIPKTARIMAANKNFNVADYKTWYANPTDYKIKTALMNGHFKKVIASDAILVINNEKNGIAGYIGGNVLMEMTAAHLYKKPIFLWNAISAGFTIEEEIRGLNPVMINRDLSKIK